jgi:hypothetical protein
MQFTSISASWLNLVERWFAELTTKTAPRQASIFCAQHLSYDGTMWQRQTAAIGAW